MGFIDRLKAGYTQGQESSQRARETKETRKQMRTLYKEHKAKAEAKKNPSDVGIWLGKAEYKTRGTRKAVSSAAKKAAPKIKSGAEKVHGFLIDTYGPPKQSTPRKRRRSTSGSKTINIRVSGSSQPKKRSKRSTSSDDDFFTSRGF